MLCIFESQHHDLIFHAFSSFRSVAQSCPTLCNPMNRSMPGLPVHHQLREFTQTHVHRVGMSSNHLILCHPLLLLPPIPPSIMVFPMSQLFEWGDQSIGVSASASVHPMNTQDWSPLGWTGWISPCSPRGSQESSPTPQFKSINFLVLSFLHSPTLTSIHDHWKTIPVTRQTFVGKVVSLLFNMLSRLVITFLPRSKHLLISWLQSPSVVILEPKKIVWHCFHCLNIYFPWGDGTRCHDLSFLNVKL